jgi:asparagine N-glycosylation enzyme membrane subunit Stt3
MASTGDLNPHWFGNPASTIIYSLTVVFHLWHFLTQNGSLLQADPNLQIHFEADFVTYTVLARLVSITFAVLSIPLIFYLGKRVFNGKVALIGTLLFIFYGVVVTHVQVARSDSAGLFFSSMSLLLLHRLYENRTFQDQLLAGAAIGLAISSRYFLLALVPIFGLVNIGILWQSRQSKIQRRRYVGQAVIGLLIIAATFILTTPYFALDFSEVILSLRRAGRGTHLGADGLTPIGNLLWYVTVVLPQNMGWPQVILLFAGIAIVLRERKFGQMMLLFYLAIFILGISLLSLHWQRWLIPILPICALLVAHALWRILTILKRSKYADFRTASAVAILGVLLLLAWPAYQTTLFNIRHSRPTTRGIAREWIVDNLPEDSSLAVDTQSVPLDGTDFTWTMWNTLAKERELTDYRSEGYDYIVVSGRMYDLYAAEPERYQKEFDFYEQLFENGKLVRFFEPSLLRGGPKIYIYNLGAD